jgi:rare lipoprotein A
VRVNDRGPYHQGRLIDVSSRTAKLLGFYDGGTTRVRVDYVGKASLQGSDDTRLEATLRNGTPAPSPSEVKLAAVRAFAPRSAAENVPVPPGRPFELGQNGEPIQPTSRSARHVSPGEGTLARASTSPATKTAAANSYRTASVGEPRTGFAARFAPANGLPVAPQEAEPLSAYAPASNGAVMTGRGLY